MKPWITLNRQTVYTPPRVSIEIHTIELPDGQVLDDWPWVIAQDYVNVLTETDENEFLIFRQTKYAADGITLAPVGGYVDPGETPLKAAQRELLEETGYQAKTWIALGSYPVDLNRGFGKAHLFLARGAQKISEPTEGDLEEQELLQYSRADLEAALQAGAFKGLSWSAVIALSLHRL